MFIKAVIAAAAVHDRANDAQGPTRTDLHELEQILTAAQRHLDAVQRRQAAVLFDDAAAAVASRSAP